MLRLVVHLRERAREARRRVMAELDVTHGRGQLNLFLPAGGLRWGVELADGQRVTTADDYTPGNARPDEWDPDWVPDRPALTGSGRPTVWGRAWSRGIAETSTTVDAGPIRQAADQATPLWE